MNLDVVLKQKKVSQAQLARWIGVSKVSVSYWVRGINNPSYDTLVKIAKALNCTIDEITGTRSNTRRLIDNKLDRMSDRQLRKVLTLINEAQI